MLALVKMPNTEIVLNGEGAAVVLDFLKTRFQVEVWTSEEARSIAPDEELVNVDETEYGKANRYRVLAGARLKAEMTQKELAEKVGIRQSTLCEYEKGKRRITPKMAVRFAAALNTYPEKFITE